MTNIRTPEDVAAETVEACARILDDEALSVAQHGTSPLLSVIGDLAQILRDNRTSIILAVTKPMEA